jgi:hypothetical protein
MGLFSRSNSNAPATPNVPGMPKPISKDDAANIAPPPGSTGSTGVVFAASNRTNSVIAPPPPTERQIYLQQLKVRIHQQLVERLDVQNLRTLPHETVRSEVRVLIRELCQSEKGLINSAEQERLMDEVMDETFGLGPLETLLKDPAISDILVNKWDRVYCERKGRIELSEVRFRDNAHLRQIIDRIVGVVGRRIDETSPMVDARLADGSRVNAIIPPLALDGPAMSIRRFGSKPMQLEDLIRAGAFPPAVMDFLAAAVQARCNILISEPLHPIRRTRHHDRGRRGTAAAAAARRATGNTPEQHRRQGRSLAARPREELSAHAARSRDHRRMSVGRSARHAPGDEHRPRRFDDHRAREQHARCNSAPGGDGRDGGVRYSDARVATAGRQRNPDRRAGIASDRRQAKGHPRHRDHRHGG